MDLTVDIESYSDLDLKKVGLHVYAAHPSTRILIAAWAVDDDPVASISEGSGGLDKQRLVALLQSDDATVHAWNAAFEVALFYHCWGVEIPLERVRCDMVHAMSLALPGSLAQAGKAIGLDPELLKSSVGTRLINKFCKPRKPTKGKPWARCTIDTDPEDWAQFVGYCRQDVEAERAIHQRLRAFPMRAADWAEWRLDQKINTTGLPIDSTLVRGAIAADAAGRKPLVEESKRITGLANPNSLATLRKWLADQGVDTPNLTKTTVRDLLLEELPEDVRRALELRQQLGKTSVTKYQALDRATCEDGRLRGSLQFYGASRTGRWAGRIFQPQNIPRGSIKSTDQLHQTVERVRAGGEATADELSSCIRSAVRAPEGQLIRVADLANIESRILGWLAHSRRMLSCFASGGDIYRDFGGELFRMPAADLSKEQRNYSKPPTLGCGYGLGADGLVAYAAGMGQEMNIVEANDAVMVFRRTYHEVVRLWRLLEGATKDLIEYGKPGEGRRVGRLVFELKPPFLFMRLPSGRRLAYYKPKVEMQMAPWGDRVPTVTYMGVDQYTRKWTRMSTFGGKWVEQACQAISRDLLAHGMALADDMQFEVIGHTHDELQALSDADSWLDHEVLSWCMYQPPPWADEHLHLDAEGFSDIIYRKD